MDGELWINGVLVGQCEITSGIEFGECSQPPTFTTTLSMEFDPPDLKPLRDAIDAMAVEDAMKDLQQAADEFCGEGE